MDAAARVDHGVLGGQQHLGGAVDVAGGRGRAVELGGGQELGLALVLHRLGRQLDLDRPRAGPS
jgi:hypothetical protein